jgi:phosphoribosylformimino-5-aminoimidazole carboxamide ribotide isomerase
MSGGVVRAYRGERERYAPLSTRLCPDSDPIALAHRFQIEYGAKTLYVADLDAIRGKGNNLPTLRAISQTLPKLELWVDAGIGDRAAFARFRRECPGRPVIGSETLVDPQLPAANPTAILSLDYLDTRLLGMADLLQHLGPAPRDLILMSMRRIGTGSGPDLELLSMARSRLPTHRPYVAGGIRNVADLALLATAGAAGVLLASALHDGRISPTDAAAYMD